MTQPGFRIDIVEFADLDQRGEDRPTLAAGVPLAKEQLLFCRESKDGGQ
jgi:hypothetical protein